MTNIPPLPNWTILSIERNTQCIVLVAKPNMHPKSCPKCRAKALHKHGTKTVIYKDKPMDQPVRLHAVLNRFLCCDCKSTFIAYAKELQQGMRMTRRCVIYIQKQVKARRSYTHIARMVGCDEKTIRKVAKL